MRDQIVLLCPLSSGIKRVKREKPPVEVQDKEEHTPLHVARRLGWDEVRSAFRTEEEIQRDRLRAGTQRFSEHPEIRLFEEFAQRSFPCLIQISVNEVL